MIALLLDQGLPYSTAHRLRERGFDAVHVADLGLSEAPDALILEHARADHRVICTLDSDFHALLALAGARQPSVILLRAQGYKAAECAQVIEEVVTRVHEALLSGAVVTVSGANLRLRRLPIQ